MIHPKLIREVVAPVVISLVLSFRAYAVVPSYTISDGIVRIAGVSASNPIIYDNDWWTDVPDAAYLWTKASLGEAKLVGNIITRCTFGWEKEYAHSLKQQTDEAERLMRLATETGLKNVPSPVIGSTVALRKPANGRVEDTEFERTAGSALIVAKAAEASTERDRCWYSWVDPAQR